ncbi:SDR family NAD(P)-dependent oxidoreductase [Acuticoccus mangrovi]|uniref:SDR family oxidoreductase n=1 Tax=Acuticoccus mangrovi TaxID=2796142 RepID=A0A934IRB8_9HYPH|nr:SDR family oxidoreductase [Acuticoccus mangrovi]MBJ3777291.1 SDR family oxidoreductase [Acuticoccus mangrovi]
MTNRPLAILTGASAGIGTALARVMAADGYDLLLVARRADRLAALAAELPGTHATLPLDLTRDDAGETLARHVEALDRPVDVLVNNAGFGDAGPFAETDLAPQLGMVDLNIRALVELTHRLLPGMLQRGHGGIINIASTAAFQPGPNMAVYYASKAFVLSFSEALYEECRPSGVTVCAICPGPTDSEFGEISGLAKHRVFKTVKRMTSEAVAEIGWRGFKKRRRVVITGTTNRLVAGVAKASPHRVVLPVVKHLQTRD